jgi:hypothetical protein
MDRAARLPLTIQVQLLATPFMTKPNDSSLRWGGVLFSQGCPGPPHPLNPVTHKFPGCGGPLN